MSEPIYKNVKSTFYEASKAVKMPKKPVRFFTYRQNNSGGSFDRNDDLDVVVIVAGTSARDANSRAERLGIYFDGEGDCECCGNRWSAAYDEGDEEPLVYGKTPEAYVAGDWSSPIIIHYPDGSKRKVERTEGKHNALY